MAPWLSADTKSPILELVPKLVEGVQDTWIWSKNVTGICTVKSAYQMLKEASYIQYIPKGVVGSGLGRQRHRRISNSSCGSFVM